MLKSKNVSEQRKLISEFQEVPVIEKDEIKKEFQVLLIKEIIAKNGKSYYLLFCEYRDGEKFKFFVNTQSILGKNILNFNLDNIFISLKEVMNDGKKYFILV